MNEYSNKGEHLAIIKTPSITVVAAWIKVDTRVGYSLIISYTPIRQRNTIQSIR